MYEEKNLVGILNNMIASIPEAQSAAIISIEGLPIASVLPPHVDETKNAAMIAAILSLAELTTQEFKKGFFEQVFIRGQNGYVFAMIVGQSAVLSFSTTKHIKLGLIFQEAKRTCEKLAECLL